MECCSEFNEPVAECSGGLTVEPGRGRDAARNLLGIGAQSAAGVGEVNAHPPLVVALATTLDEPEGFEAT